MSVTTIATSTSAELFTKVLQTQEENSALKDRIAQLEQQLAHKNERAALSLLKGFLDSTFVPRTGFGSVASPAEEQQVATVLKGLLPLDSPVTPLLLKVSKAWDAHDARDTLLIVQQALKALCEA